VRQNLKKKVEVIDGYAEMGTIYAFGRTNRTRIPGVIGRIVCIKRANAACRI
jgi:hypothetical protein